VPGTPGDQFNQAFKETALTLEQRLRKAFRGRRKARNTAISEWWLARMVIRLLPIKITVHRFQARRLIVKYPQLTIEDQATLSPSYTTQIALRINGLDYTLDVEPRVSLLDALREYLHLTGSKKGCNQGACGACTVLCNGERVLSCLSLAIQYQGSEITTIEGLSADGSLHPLQSAFVEHDGFQCGYCTPGQICSAIGMAGEFRNGLPSAVTPDVAAGVSELSEEEIQERMSGNLCRCGAYIGIRAAIRATFGAEVPR
jgi:xanthine dehydrogenase YagT iron-sulfur-binding subunit